MSFAPDAKPFAKPENLLTVPVGFTSPLWGLFAGAAVSGAAWWWMTRWIQPQNLEAMFGATADLETSVATPGVAPAPAVAAAEPPVIDLLGAVLDPALETPIAAPPEPISEVVLEAVADAEPVLVVDAQVAEIAVSEPTVAQEMAALSDTDLLSESAANSDDAVEPLVVTEAAAPSDMEAPTAPVVEPSPPDAAQPRPAAKTKKKAAAPKLDL